MLGNKTQTNTIIISKDRRRKLLSGGTVSQKQTVNTAQRHSQTCTCL